MYRSIDAIEDRSNSVDSVSYVISLIATTKEIMNETSVYDDAAAIVNQNIISKRSEKFATQIATAVYSAGLFVCGRKKPAD